MKKAFKDYPELVFITCFSAFCLLYYLASWVAFAKFLGIFTASLFSPLVITGAIASAFIGRKYSTFLYTSFGIGFVVAIIQEHLSSQYMSDIGFGGRPADAIAILADTVSVAVLANSINLIRAWARAPKKQELESQPQQEDTAYYLKNLDEKSQ